MEGLAHCGEAVRARLSSVVHGAHVLVACVAWNFDCIVLDDVLLNDRFPLLLSFALPNGTWVNVGFG